MIRYRMRGGPKDGWTRVSPDKYRAKNQCVWIATDKKDGAECHQYDYADGELRHKGLCHESQTTISRP